MNYLLHGATLALAWFLVLDAALSFVVMSMSAREWTIESSGFWLALRLLPAGGAALFVAAVFVPAYALYEPRATAEGFDLTLTSAAVAALCLVAAAAARAAAAWMRANARSRAWLAAAHDVTSRADVPTFEIDSAAPIMALVGVFRPRLIVSRRLTRALSPEEFSASVAHEVGHSRAWDNLKRLAICAAPDLLPASAARVLERRWAAAAEHAADGHAAAGGASMRCALASALVKVARLIPANPPSPSGLRGDEPPVEPISTLIGGGDVTLRVERLLRDGPAVAPRGAGRMGLLPAAAGVCAAILAYAPLLHAVHQATEVLVNALP